MIDGLVLGERATGGEPDEGAWFAALLGTPADVERFLGPAERLVARYPA